MNRNTTTYRFGAGIALVAAFVLIWMNLGVGLIGEPENPANLMYAGVLAVGFTGAIIARFRPHGMALALYATALAQALAAAIAVLAGLGTPGYPTQTVFLTLNGVFVALFVGSALLFRSAARAQVPAGAGPGVDPGTGTVSTGS